MARMWYVPESRKARFISGVSPDRSPNTVALSRPACAGGMAASSRCSSRVRTPKMAARRRDPWDARITSTGSRVQPSRNTPWLARYAG